MSSVPPIGQTTLVRYPIYEEEELEQGQSKLHRIGKVFFQEKKVYYPTGSADIIAPRPPVIPVREIARGKELVPLTNWVLKTLGKGGQVETTIIKTKIRPGLIINTSPRVGRSILKRRKTTLDDIYFDLKEFWSPGLIPSTPTHLIEVKGRFHRLNVSSKRNI